MTSALLFAMVDAVLTARLDSALLDQDMPQTVWSGAVWQRAMALGWWRSTWQRGTT